MSKGSRMHGCSASQCETCLPNGTYTGVIILCMFHVFPEPWAVCGDMEQWTTTGKYPDSPSEMPWLRSCWFLHLGSSSYWLLTLVYTAGKRIDIKLPAVSVQNQSKPINAEFSTMFVLHGFTLASRMRNTLHRASAPMALQSLKPYPSPATTWPSTLRSIPLADQIFNTVNKCELPSHLVFSSAFSAIWLVFSWMVTFLFNQPANYLI